MWYRVFGSNEAAVEPAALLEHLHGKGLEVAGQFRGDDQGWFQADLVLPGEEPVKLERYLATEEGIRAQLNSWAAWLETVPSPHQGRLMQHMISTREVFTLLVTPDHDDLVAELGSDICRYLAAETDGVYQVDGRGFFNAQGELLVKE